MAKKRKEKPVKMTVKVSPDVYAKWKSKAKFLGITLSDMVRQAVDKGEIVGRRKCGRRYAPVDPLLIRQLAGIGNNLNQIAKKLNIGEEPDTEMAGTLEEIEKSLKEILAKHKSGVETEE